MIELVAETYVPKPLDQFFEQGKRFYILYGGRESGKSWAVAAELIEMSLQAKHRILCCREIQNSIKHSVKKLLEDTIGRLGLVPFFEVRDTMIRCRPTGSEFLFAGLRRRPPRLRQAYGDHVRLSNTAAPTKAHRTRYRRPCGRYGGGCAGEW